GCLFGRALAGSGFTERVFRHDEQEQLLGLGLGITNVVARATARADELRPEEFIQGACILNEKITRLQPRWLAVVGVTAYRAAFGRPGAAVGPQDGAIGENPGWGPPHPHGLDAHWGAASLAAEFARLRAALPG